MKGADGPVCAPITMFSFNTLEDIQQFGKGSDADIGGLSTANLKLEERPEINQPIGKEATGVFWGDMRLKVKPGMEGRIRGGYAGIKSKNRRTLFGAHVEDASAHDFLALRLRVAGDPITHNSYYVNIQTDGAFNTDLWQHRLFFRKRNNTWENVFIPFDNFVRTNAGELSQHQMPMDRERIKSIGISILGANSGVEGKYELGLDTITLVNEEDVTYAPPEEKSSETDSLNEKLP